MTKTIRECITGLSKAFTDSNFAKSTSDSYCRIIDALVRKSTYSFDDYCSDIVIGDLLRISEDQHTKNNTSRNYYLTQKLSLDYLKKYLTCEENETHNVFHRQVFTPNFVHQQIVSNILESSESLCPSAKYVTSIHLRKFFCYTEKRNIKDEDINDQIVFDFLKECFDSTKSSMDRIVRAMGLLSGYFLKHNIGNIKLDFGKMLTGPKNVRLIPAYNPEEIEKILSVINTCTSKGLRDKAIIVLAFATGLRSIDICNLKFENIDYKSETISVVQSKTKQPLVLPVPPTVLNDIADYILYGRPVSDSEYIFLSVKKSGGNLKSNLGSILNNYCEKAGVQKIPGRSFHGLRKAFFTESIKAGVPVDLASEMIGHQDLKEDKAYYSFDEETNAFVAGDFSDIPVSGNIYSSVMNRSSQ